jgi:RNA polymerase sigma-70 factor (ECF subfamily)
MTPDTDQKAAQRSVASDAEFQAALVEIIPQMRAFARSLCRNGAEAEDLAQEAVARAWSNRGRFEMGTNIKAWAFMILRNQFYSDKRRSWRSVPLDPEFAAQTLVAVTNPSGNLELDELRRAMSMIPDEQREALILIGAGGLSYEEASEICGVAIGTMKSRVSRARDRLALIYATGQIVEDGELPGGAMDCIFAQMAHYRQPHAA